MIEKRLAEIVKIVDERKMVTVQELMEIFHASESTIRRDLVLLDRNGQLNKVHGGAVALDSSYFTKDADVDYRMDLNKEEKLLIAKYAARLLKPNDFVYLDAGTTTELMIDYITERNIEFVTNAIVHGRKLAKRGYIVYILGGNIKDKTEAVVGEEAIASLRKYNFTKGFFGSNGVSSEYGYSTPDTGEALVKKEAWKHCMERYVLADSSKFHHISSVTFADFTDGTVITSSLKDEGLRKYKNIREVKEL